MSRRTPETRRDNEAYVPGHGDPSLRVLSYDIDLDVKLAGNHVEGEALLQVEPVAGPLERFTLNLHRLKVVKVTVDGGPAKVTHRGVRLTIVPRRPLPAGRTSTVRIRYAGNPTQVRGIDGLAGWEELEDGVIVASQPHGSPSWFPCNDRPGDKARYRYSITTDNDYEVVANGSLVATRRRSSRTTWIYEQPEPMASYLATLQIGRYATRDVPGSVTPVRLHFPPLLRAQVEAGPMMRHGDMIEAFSELFGPYPFARYDVVITEDPLEIPLEAQTLSIFGSNYVAPGWERERLVAHELAHQWFGNSVTLEHWRDIWLHEGFACYSEWLWSERSGGRPAAAHAQMHYRGLARKAQDLLLADPSPQKMFDDRVYKRGACLLHALRERVGDERFFALLRSWCARHRYGTVTTAMFVAEAAAVTGVKPAWFDPWLYETPLP